MTEAGQGPTPHVCLNEVSVKEGVSIKYRTSTASIKYRTSSSAFSVLDISSSIKHRTSTASISTEKHC